MISRVSSAGPSSLRPHMRRIKCFPHAHPPPAGSTHSHHHPLRSNFSTSSRSQSNAPQFKFKPDFYVVPPIPSNTPISPPPLPIPPAIPQVHKQKQEPTAKAKAFEELSFKAWKKRQRKAWRKKQRKASENTSLQASTSRLTEPLYLPAPEHLRKDAREPYHEPSTSELKKDDDASLIITERSDVREVEVEEQAETLFRYLTALPFPDFISTIRTHYHHPSNHDPDHDQQTPSTARSDRPSQSPSSSPQPSSPAKPRPRPRPQLVENLRWRVKWEKTLERKRRNSASALTSDASNSSLHSGAEDATYSSFLTPQTSSSPAPSPPRTLTPSPSSSYSSSPLLSHRLYTAPSIYGVLIRPEWIEKAKERYKLRKEAQIGGYGGGSRGWRWRVGKYRVGFGRKTIPIESKTC
ncbi:uncharacterized protein STEHIDRAFT_137291 [Stereum hirsutum FP-91666 SS1]|uniref:uncharacterized protein n=1 Tax=Stereum hirsutum (strain FP-91666) TaxID=721885 RepID=UPI000440C779|nr:uncharacterized protein STEHIDRAFT_137291 [Stereum hirsutum FP-91666 SS1]EIM89491.1 hypothetical protein STEHIDRAFT_137291 [Stereum hirsutum FP-91666 SS1]